MKDLHMPSLCSTRDLDAMSDSMSAAFSRHDIASHAESTADPVMYDNGSSSSFEFPKGERATARPVATASTHLRFGPSKWDDAEKWLANSHHSSRPKTISVLLAHNPQKQQPAAYINMKDGALLSNGAAHIIKEDVSFSMARGQNTDVYQQEDTEGTSYGSAGENNSFAFPDLPSKVRSTNNTFDFYPHQDEEAEMKELSISHEGDYNDALLKPAEPPAWDRASYVMPEPSLRSVSMRDMGTEMTPIASQEPSRTGTPIQATTPSMRSPVSSGSSTPRRAAPASSPLQPSEDAVQPLRIISTPDDERTLSELCENDMQAKNRKDIETLGVQLGKINVVAWTSREDEDGDSSKLLKNIDLEEVKKNVLETRAAAWEEAEEAKYMARFEREEAKIQAWENHQKAKAEAEMRRIEVKIEKIRSHAHEKLMNKLAVAKRRAEERRAVAEARRSEQAAKTVEQVNLIRRTGRMPSHILSCAFCP